MGVSPAPLPSVLIHSVFESLSGEQSVQISSTADWQYNRNWNAEKSTATLLSARFTFEASPHPNNSPQHICNT